MRPGRPKKGDAAASKSLKIRLRSALAEEVLRRGAGPYVRSLVVADIGQRKEPTGQRPPRGPRMRSIEVHFPADIHKRILELGGSAYVRELVEQDQIGRIFPCEAAQIVKTAWDLLQARSP
jgi:hypothetical protein